MDILLWIAIIVLILLPPSFDPAIRIKMRQMFNGTHPEAQGAEWIVWRDPKNTGSRLYLVVNSNGHHWTANREDAARFNTAKVACDTIRHLDERDSVKVRSGWEIA